MMADDRPGSGTRLTAVEIHDNILEPASAFASELGSEPARKAAAAAASPLRFPISALGLPHSIAGSVEAFYLAASGHGTWGAMLGDFALPSVLETRLEGFCWRHC